MGVFPVCQCGSTLPSKTHTTVEECGGHLVMWNRIGLWWNGGQRCGTERGDCGISS
jgi:hypothetical protein